MSTLAIKPYQIAGGCMPLMNKTNALRCPQVIWGKYQHIVLPSFWPNQKVIKKINSIQQYNMGMRTRSTPVPLSRFNSEQTLQITLGYCSLNVADFDPSIIVLYILRSAILC